MIPARIVVTLPPAVRGDPAVELAAELRRRGAELLELRTDLHPARAIPVEALAAQLPLLVAERGTPIPADWLRVAGHVDRPLGSPPAGAHALVSWHGDRALSATEAVALWSRAALPAAMIKHVEPIATPAEGLRLLATQQALGRLFPGRVTVLATGPLALPFRCLLSERNQLDYVAADGSWAAAAGQRLLDDAVRERRATRGGPRRAILGHGIGGSRSPRTHRQPYDRIDLPEDADVSALLEALHPFYEGFAVTSPFKRAAARSIGARLPAINTLVRRPRGWQGANTDVAGALRCLERLGPAPVTALGDGGATAALRLACADRGQALVVSRRADARSAPLTGSIVWTWPARIEAPGDLCFRDARVAVLAYGAAGRRIAGRVRERGGVPVHVGPAWFVAQAREQRRLWGGAALPLPDVPARPRLEPA